MIIRLKSNLRLLEAHFPKSLARKMAECLGEIDIDRLNNVEEVYIVLKTILKELEMDSFWLKPAVAGVIVGSRPGIIREHAVRGLPCPSAYHSGQRRSYKSYRTCGGDVTKTAKEMISKGLIPSSASRIRPKPPKGPPPREAKPSKFVGYIVAAGLVAFTAALVIIFGVTK